jgi:hypothetical protein
MCGLAGIFNFRTQEPVSARLIKVMTDTLVHRGPDDEGFYISDPVGLGHRRLSIIDLEGGHQPLANEDETVMAGFQWRDSLLRRPFCSAPEPPAFTFPSETGTKPVCQFCLQPR